MKWLHMKVSTKSSHRFESKSIFSQLLRKKKKKQGVIKLFNARIGSNAFPMCARFYAGMDRSKATRSLESSAAIRPWSQPTVLSIRFLSSFTVTSPQVDSLSSISMVSFSSKWKICCYRTNTHHATSAGKMAKTPDSSYLIFNKAAIGSDDISIFFFFRITLVTKRVMFGACFPYVSTYGIIYIYYIIIFVLSIFWCIFEGKKRCAGLNVAAQM